MTENILFLSIDFVIDFEIVFGGFGYFGGESY